MTGSLPRGLFSIPRTSGISISRVYSLIKICEDLHRVIVIVTDMPIERDIGASEIVLVNPPLSDGDMFDYAFSSGEPGGETEALDMLSPLIHGRTWKCWMPRREGETPASEALVRAREIIATGFECACIPGVAVQIGPLRDMFINEDGPITSVMAPNSGEGFWREVFRSSGYYGASAMTIIQGVG